MRKKVTAALSAAALAALLAGCGYKGPPYYEKPIQPEESSVAL